MLLAVAGVADAVLLTIQHYADLNLPCTIAHGCETVLTSKYAVVAGVPVAAFGVLFYLAVLMMAFYIHQNDEGYKWLFALTTLGLLTSAGLTAIEGFSIHAWCQYCLLSALISVLLFVFSAILLQKKRGVKQDGTGSESRN